MIESDTIGRGVDGMHWLKAWRLAYIRPDGKQGLSRKELAQMVRQRRTARHPEQEIGCSERLIEILEGGGITHPEIADRIAQLTGASIEQRNGLTHKKHWLNELPEPPRRAAERKRKPGAERSLPPANRREIVKINMLGEELARFRSIKDAAKADGCASTTVFRRCRRKLEKGENEFLNYGCSWRYAKIWDAMQLEERKADLQTGYICIARPKRGAYARKEGKETHEA